MDDLLFDAHPLQYQQLTGEISDTRVEERPYHRRAPQVFNTIIRHEQYVEIESDPPCEIIAATYWQQLPCASGRLGKNRTPICGLQEQE